jgi:hypothetical protein
MEINECLQIVFDLPIGIEGSNDVNKLRLTLREIMQRSISVFVPQVQ